MQKKSVFLSALLLGAGLTFSGCSDSDSGDSSEELALEQDGKTLFFYSSSTNDHLAYDVDEDSITDLNTNDDEDLVNYQMTAEEQGKFFIWLDNKGDDNASNDEEKVVMMHQDYSYATDGNITWEDFYYLGHFHAETDDDNETHYHLAAHSNDEFDLSNVPEEDLETNAKYKGLIRLNTYIAGQELIKENIQNTLSSLATPATLCGFKSITNDSGTRNYAMGTDGQLYVFNNTLSEDNTYGYIDQAVVSESCEENKMGISSVTHEDENGVLVYEASSQKLYLVDSHDGGVYHVHSTFDVSDVIGDASAEMMVSILPVGYEADEDHDH
jgi:hypothetical protein